MRLRLITPFIITSLAVAMVSIPSVAAASYTLSISPNVPVSLGTTMTIGLSLTGGTKNSAYSITFDVVKPNGVGSALATRIISTNNMGTGSVSLSYPDPSWTALNGTVATDEGGVYNVYANQTSPTAI